MLKFRLLALGEDDRIEREIEGITKTWSKHFALDESDTEKFRERLYNLVREGMVEDIEGFARRHH
jgi:hypothetical protein